MRVASSIVMVGALVALVMACGRAPAAGEGGIAREDVCQRFGTTLSPISVGEAESIVTDVDGGSTTSRRALTPPLAEQHLAAAKDLRRFGTWARGAEEQVLADRALAIEREANGVLQQLQPDDADARAEEITAPLYAQTTQLYAECYRDVFEEEMNRETQ